MTSAAPISSGIDDIRDVVGDANARPAAPDDAIDGIVPQWFVEPASADEISRVLSIANSAKLTIIARGGCTKLEWGNPPRSVNVILSTARMNRVIEHAAGDMTATVQAGCTIAALNEVLAERGQRLALDPLWPARATVGGVLGTNDNGPLRATFGSARDHLIGITAVLADGTIARSGGKVVKNVAGYDLPKLFIGSLGTLGVMTEATFRLYPRPQCTRNLFFSTHANAAIGDIVSVLDHLSPVVSAAQIDAANDSPPGISVLIEGLEAAIDQKSQRAISALAECGCQPADSPENIWSAREQLFSDPAASVARISFLPTQWPDLLNYLGQSASSHGIRWKIVAQAIGVALLKLEGDSLQQIGAGFIAIRRHLENSDGSLVLLHCPAPLKSMVDVWPEAGNALPLMRRIKNQFDSGGILSPGRFVGGI